MELYEIVAEQGLIAVIIYSIPTFMDKLNYFCYV